MGVRTSYLWKDGKPVGVYSSNGDYTISLDGGKTYIQSSSETKRKLDTPKISVKDGHPRFDWSIKKLESAPKPTAEEIAQADEFIEALKNKK